MVFEFDKVSLQLVSKLQHSWPSYISMMHTNLVERKKEEQIRNEYMNGLTIFYESTKQIEVDHFNICFHQHFFFSFFFSSIFFFLSLSFLICWNLKQFLKLNCITSTARSQMEHQKELQTQKLAK